MPIKNTYKITNSIIILVFALSTIFISILYFVEKEKLKNTTMYYYEREVEEPLVSISYHLGVEPYEIVEWEEPIYVEELESLIYDLEVGFRKIDSHNLAGIPKQLKKELQTLQVTFISIPVNISYGGEITEEAKRQLLDLSKVIDSCKVRAYNEDWKQIISEMECVNNGI